METNQSNDDKVIARIVRNAIEIHMNNVHIEILTELLERMKKEDRSNFDLGIEEGIRFTRDLIYKLPITDRQIFLEQERK